mgnify:CR=1 FL=1
MTEPASLGPRRATSATLIAAYLAAAGGAFAQASFEFMMVPLQSELGLSVDQITGLSLIPAAASLAAVFVVGALGDRVGPRRMLTVASIVSVVGALLVMAAPGWAAVVLGRAIGGIGGIALAVTGLAMLNEAAGDERARGRLFGYFAAIVPATFLVASILASVVSAQLSWRLVPVAWIVIALVVLAAGLRVQSRTAAGEARGELWTPLLAGLALAGIGLAASLLAGSAIAAILALTVSVACGLVLVVLMRSLQRPSLDLRLLRAPGALLLCGAIILATLTNLFFFVNLFLQYRFPTAVVGLSLLFAVPQALAVLGGIAGGRLSSRVGPFTAAILALFAAAVLSLGFLLVRADSAMWVPIAVLAVFAVPAAGMVGPLTQSLMGRAPADGSSAASSIKSATWSLGGILGGVTVGALGFSVFTRSLAGRLQESGLDLPAAEFIAEQVRSGAFVSELAQQLVSTHPPSADLLAGSATGLHLAQVDALHAAAVAGCATFGLAALLVALARRRILPRGEVVVP